MSQSTQNREKRSFLVSRDPSIDRRYRPRPQRKVRLFNETTNGIAEEEEEQNYSDGESVSISGDENFDPSGNINSINSENESSNEGALVYLRFRPIQGQSTAYSTRGNVLVVGPSSETNSTSNNKNAMEKHYSFTDIFHRDIPQASVYENCVRLKIEFEESFTLLTYGTSGSGKTHTLLGSDSQPGIIPRSLEQIFTLYAAKIYPNPVLKLINGRVTVIEDPDIQHCLELRNSLLSDCAQNTTMEATRALICKEHNFNDEIQEDVSIFIWVSFVEIYNENVYDLLEAPTPNVTMAPPTRRNLKIVGNDGRVFIKGLNSMYVRSSSEALHLLRYGLQRVNYASTSINMNSSRSHCIFIVDVLKYFRSGSFFHISYKFCDLAGSERLLKTGNVGSRLKEAQRINTSLLVLGRCLDAANSQGRKKNCDIIPFRESKLTMLLQSALLGKEKLTMIVNVMPTDKYYEENINVLGFASIAKNIIFKQPAIKMQKSRCSIIFDFDDKNDSKQSSNVQQFIEENIFLRSEVSRLTDTLEMERTDHAIKLLELEQELRTKLLISHQEMMAKQQKVFEEKIKLEKAELERQCEQKIRSLTRKYEWEIEDLRDDLNKLGNAEKHSIAKRPTLDASISDSPPSENELV